MEKDKQSDWARFCGNVADFWNKYGSYVLMAALVVALIFAGARFMKQKAEAEREDDWSALNDASNIFEYRKVAKEATSPSVKALALIRGGNQILSKVNAPPADPRSKPMTEAEIAQELKDAEGLFKQALGIEDLHAAYLFQAHMGLGAIAESRRDIKAARTHYGNARKVAEGQHEGMVARAKYRLAWLDRLNHPVTIAPDAPPDPTAGLPQLRFPLVPNNFYPLLSPNADLLSPPTGPSFER